MEVVDLPRETTAVVNPQADGFFQSAGDVEHGASAIVSSGQIQGTVQVALLTAAGGLAAGAGAFDQGAAQERLFGDELDESGARLAFGSRAVGAVLHGCLLSPLCSDIPLYVQNEQRRQAHPRMRICSSNGRPS